MRALGAGELSPGVQPGFSSMVTDFGCPPREPRAAGLSSVSGSCRGSALTQDQAQGISAWAPNWSQLESVATLESACHTWGLTSQGSPRSGLSQGIQWALHPGSHEGNIGLEFLQPCLWAAWEAGCNLQLRSFRARSPQLPSPLHRPSLEGSPLVVRASLSPELEETHLWGERAGPSPWPAQPLARS